ncbi:hypothetical protein E2C01_061925 [Portunus trituberculatus]|uniref:Transmembrane protein n=1 Tax=Portunus trituberculatus TaxID=210409 RepID=A0A5B7H9L4_PORTR|nr:hypothetical protein [Portunus trituberculatus]
MRRRHICLYRDVIFMVLSGFYDGFACNIYRLRQVVVVVVVVVVVALVVVVVALVVVVVVVVVE